jgi:hypothetical protein
MGQHAAAGLVGPVAPGVHPRPGGGPRPLGCEEREVADLHRRGVAPGVAVMATGLHVLFLIGMMT